MHAVLFLLAIFMVSLVQAASFDCTKSQSMVEHLICDNPEISKLDDTLSLLYTRSLERGSDKSKTIKEQRNWIKDVRNACQDADCLKTEYMLRYSVLSSTLDVESAPAQTKVLPRKVRHKMTMQQIRQLREVSHDAKDTCIALAELADKNELRKLTIETNGKLSEEEIKQFDKLDDLDSQYSGELYQLQLNFRKPPVKFASFTYDGTCRTTHIFNLRSILTSKGKSTGWIDVNDPDNVLSYIGTTDYLIKYKNHYYIITPDLSDINSAQVISAIQRNGTILPMCSLEKDKPEYVVSSGSKKFCTNIANGSFKPMEWKANEIDMDDREEYAKIFGGYAESVDQLSVDLDDSGTKANIGRFTFNSGAGCGSTRIWGRVLNEDLDNVKTGELNNVVSQFEQSFEIYEINKEHFVRIGIDEDKEQVIQIRKGKIEQVCELQKKPHSKINRIFEAIKEGE